MYTFNSTGETRLINHHIDCNSKNVIYMIQCNHCREVRYRKLTNVAQNVKKVASKNLKKHIACVTAAYPRKKSEERRLCLTVDNRVHQ